MIVLCKIGWQIGVGFNLDVHRGNRVLNVKDNRVLTEKQHENKLPEDNHQLGETLAKCPDFQKHKIITNNNIKV